MHRGYAVGFAMSLQNNFFRNIFRLKKELKGKNQND